MTTIPSRPMFERLTFTALTTAVATIVCVASGVLMPRAAGAQVSATATATATEAAASFIATPAPLPPSLPTAEHCPADGDITTDHLLGTWKAQLHHAKADSPVAQPLLELRAHPEWQGNVKGTVVYAGYSALVAGDVNQGEVTLEESLDGRRISATWLGQVVDGSCARLIRGTLLTDEHPDGQAFTLHKVVP